MCVPLSLPPPSLVGGRDEREARMGVENVVRRVKEGGQGREREEEGKRRGGKEKRREREEEAKRRGERKVRG